MKKRSKIKPFPDGKQRKRKERGQVLKYQFFPTSAPKREREKFMFQVFMTLQDTTANENRPCSQNDFKSRPDPKFPPYSCVNKKQVLSPLRASVASPLG